MEDIAAIGFKFLYGLVSPIIAGIICGFFVTWRAKKDMSRRSFLDRLNFSLNILKNNHLKIRTLIEKPSSDVFLNPIIYQIVHKAARNTTAEDCLLPIEDKEDYWLCLNSLLNEVSEKFSDGFIRMDLDAAVKSEMYVMCITCEVSDNMKTRKIRAMLIKKTDLINFPATDPGVDFPSHTTRIQTLRQLSEAYRSEERKHCFVEFELCV